MAYMLQALVARSGDFPKELPARLQVVHLQAGLDMVPLTSHALKLLGIPLLPITDEGEVKLPASLAALCAELSANARLGYIEAEYFGGAGNQAHSLFNLGTPAGEPLVADDAINQALRFLGISKGEALDEFDAVGLGQQRETNEWLA
ncbi:MAG TPA: hypothetical protein VJA19_15875 [Pseudomonas sp.]|nr:hypothetical protein [Pseudomonas sp.]